MAVIARCNATALVEDGARVGVVEQRGGWLGTAVFVTVLLAVIGLVNGLYFLTVNVAVGALVLGIAAGLGFGARVLLKRKRTLGGSPAAESPWLVFDLDARVLRDHTGAVVAPLDQVSVGRTWQVTSSSRALRVKWASGALVIARGNPFGEGVDAIEDALRARGIVVT